MVIIIGFINYQSIMVESRLSQYISIGASSLYKIRSFSQSGPSKFGVYIDNGKNLIWNFPIFYFTVLHAIWVCILHCSLRLLFIQVCLKYSCIMYIDLAVFSIETTFVIPFAGSFPYGNLN